MRCRWMAFYYETNQGRQLLCGRCILQQLFGECCFGWADTIGTRVICRFETQRGFNNIHLWRLLDVGNVAIAFERPAGKGDFDQIAPVLFTDPAGINVVYGALAMMVLGIFVMWRIIDIKV